MILSRAPLYTDKETLIEFQRTLSCQSRDSFECAKRCGLSSRRTELTLLDIGGGDGEFTSRFITGLNQKGYAVKAVTDVDPGDWEEEYRNSLAGLAERVEYRREGFQSYAGAVEKFDVVMASHSLYAVLDLFKTTPDSRRQVVGKLLGLLRKGGYGFVLLAAPRAASYCFKEQALREVLGSASGDATAATLAALFSEHGFKAVCVDNIMDLSKLLQGFRAGREEGLRRWLSYFLRIDCTQIPRSQFLRICSTLNSYVVRCESLSEGVLAELHKLPLRLSAESEVLPHQTVIYFVQQGSRGSSELVPLERRSWFELAGSGK